MPWCFDVNDEDLCQYLPEILAEIGTMTAHRRLKGGSYNTGVQVHLQDGRDVVVKISPPSSAPGLTYEAGLLATESDYFRRTLPLGAPVPEVLTSGTGVIPGRHHLVMSKLPGRGGSSIRRRATPSGLPFAATWDERWPEHTRPLATASDICSSGTTSAPGRGRSPLAG